MKWYSVKKYKIPVNRGFIFVASDLDEMCMYDVAQYKHNEERDRFYWHNKDDRILMRVTHFCIPDPVEIEECK